MILFDLCKIVRMWDCENVCWRSVLGGVCTVID